MRKMFLFLLGLLLWGAAYSIPASILQYKIEPTEEQKSEFFRKAREDPELYSFNPLQVGNTWWYDLSSNTGQNYIVKGREITDSMTINDTTFYYVGVGGALSAAGFWLKNCNDKTILWDIHQSWSFNDLDDDPNTVFLTNEDFTVSSYDSDDPVWVWTTYAPCEFQVVYVSSGWMEYYGLITQYKHYSYFPSDGDLFYEVIWVRGWGPIYFGHEEADYSLVACFINGISYGTPPSSIGDNNYSNMVPVQLDASPNPSNNGINIKYQIGDRSAEAKLQIFNIRGQLLYQTGIKDSGVIHWSNRESLDSRLPAGIYTVLIKVNDIVCRSLKFTIF